MMMGSAQLVYGSAFENQALHGNVNASVLHHIHTESQKSHFGKRNLTET